MLSVLTLISLGFDDEVTRIGNTVLPVWAVAGEHGHDYVHVNGYDKTGK